MITKQRQVSVEAVVLRHTEFGEADRLIVLFSKHNGKIRAIAKGIRKIKSRKAGHLEPFTRSKMLLARGRDLWIITQAESIAAHLSIRDDLLLTAYGSYILELVDRFVVEETENPEIYTLLCETLSRIENKHNPEIVIRFFEFHLLDLLGYRPELHKCVNCRKDVFPEDQYISYQDGGVLCPNCGGRSYSAIPVKVESLKYLRHIQRSKFDDLKNIDIPDKIGSNLENILQDYLSFLLERKINSLKFIKEARNSTKYQS